jgi:hypothetical protein
VGRGVIQGQTHAYLLTPGASERSLDALRRAVKLFVSAWNRGQLHRRTYPTVVMTDGSEMDIGPNDAFYIPPGHDAWIVGNEACVALDFTGAAACAKK